jgi:predicted DNA-binding transcriptional regulator YafY
MSKTLNSYPVIFRNSACLFEISFIDMRIPFSLSISRLHESQDIIEEYPEYSIISLKTHITYELVFQILGWNSNVEVIEPEFFRKQIIELIDKMAKIYSNHQ